jgi:hypothetical protein
MVAVVEPVKRRFVRLSPLFRGVAGDVLIGLAIAAFALVMHRQGFIAFHLDDAEIEYLPATRDIARAISEGSFPLLARGLWHGGTLAGEYQYAVFNVVELAFACLLWSLKPQLASAAAAFATFHIAVLAAGVSRWCRSRGLAPGFAALAAGVAALHGWLLCWGAASWYPALVSLAFLPWLLWSLELTARPDKRPFAVIAGAVSVYLVLTGGWPFTTLMSIVLSAIAFARVCSKTRSWQPGVAIMTAWALGLALASPALIALLDYRAYTLRSQWAPAVQTDLVVPAAALSGLLVPSVSAIWEWSGPHSRLARELAGGMVPISAVAAAMLARPGFLRRHRWDALTLGIGVLLATAPGYGSFRWSFRWLPLIFFGLAPLGANALKTSLAAMTEGHSRKALILNPGTLGAALVALVSVRDLVRSYDPVEATRRLGMHLFLLLSAWALLIALLHRRRMLLEWSGLIVLLTATWLSGAQISFKAPDVGTFGTDERVRKTAPFSTDIRYLLAYGLDDSRTYPVIARPGNTTLYSRIDALNGYSPQGPRGYMPLFGIEWQGCTRADVMERTLTHELGDDGWLALAGVDGVAVAPSQLHLARALREQWTRVYDGREGSIFHRPGSRAPRARCVPSATTAASEPDLTRLIAERDRNSRIVLLNPEGDSISSEQFATCSMTSLSETRLMASANIAVQAADRDALVVFARPWAPGWRAMLDGRALPVLQASQVFLAVRVPRRSHGHLVLSYRPRCITLGLPAAALGGLGLLAISWWVRRAARRASTQGKR